MIRLSKLQRVTDYFSDFGLTLEENGGTLRVKPIMTTAQADATSKLAHLSGAQVLVARPEAEQFGDSDTHRDIVSTAIFILDKGLGLDKTVDLENAQYGRLLAIADAVLGAVADATSSGDCGLMTGLSIASVKVVPESSVFGGWSGYSVEIDFQ